MHKLSFGRKLAYGVGDLGSNFCWTFITAFAMIYFTDYVGVGSAAIGTLMMVARLLDGVTDVIFGGLIDRTQSKMGKARPWLFYSSFPLAVGLVMLFNVPAGLSAGGKQVYIFIIYTLVSAFFYTASNISYNALVSLATDNPKDRVAMGSFRFIFAAIAGILISTITMGLVESFGDGQRGWLMVSLLYAGLFLLFTLVTVFGVKEMKPAKGEAGAKQAASRVPFGKSLGLLVKNKYFLLLLGVYLVNYMYTGVSGGIGIYYATYILGDAALLGILSIAMMVPMILGLVISPVLTGKLGMQRACLYGCVFSILGPVLMMLSGGSLPLLLAGIAVRSLGTTPLAASMYALVAETSEYARLKFGADMDGVIFSCSSVGIKVGSGVGTALIGWLLAAAHYNGLADAQTQSALNMIQGIYLLVPLITSVALVVLLAFVNVEKANKQLKAKAGAK